MLKMDTSARSFDFESLMGSGTGDAMKSMLLHHSWASVGGGRQLTVPRQARVRRHPSRVVARATGGLLVAQMTQFRATGRAMFAGEIPRQAIFTSKLGVGAKGGCCHRVPLEIITFHLILDPVGLLQGLFGFVMMGTIISHMERCYKSCDQFIEVGTNHKKHNFQLVFRGHHQKTKEPIEPLVFQMTEHMIKLPADEDTPEKRVDNIFRMVDHNEDHKISFDEFQGGGKQDPATILQSNFIIV
ncbi:hypothetical protein PSTG_02452 [Puccinia striiformis f. sp. tritici PST-78]|uniref:EF-hand domain-containing protein n=1 Tax=Puccinia striiformis f. sp. tritici PST-78 TaxID=1165861 RepID=A0A0L0VZB7_9BASI|nr:hypothetical protein PSTG_02452 [Puccinia striiformis f. sp. tritici PST-78]